MILTRFRTGYTRLTHSYLLNPYILSHFLLSLFPRRTLITHQSGISFPVLTFHLSAPSTTISPSLSFVLKNNFDVVTLSLQNLRNITFFSYVFTSYNSIASFWVLQERKKMVSQNLVKLWNGLNLSFLANWVSVSSLVGDRLASLPPFHCLYMRAGAKQSCGGPRGPNFPLSLSRSKPPLVKWI